MTNKIAAVVLLIALIMAYGVVGNMDYKLQMQEEAWQQSVRAIEAEQAQIEIMILEAQEDLEWAEKQIQAHNLLIWDIRERVHLDMGWDLEGF